MRKTTNSSHEKLQLPRGLKAAVVLFFVSGTLAAGYRTTRVPVTIVVDGEKRQVFTQQDTVESLLQDAGIEYDEKNDLVAPNPATLIGTNDSGLTVYIRRARPVLVTADGQTVTVLTHGIAPKEILREARVSLGPGDEFTTEGNLRITGLGAADPGPPPRITVTRSVEIVLEDEGQTTAYRTTAPTVGEALSKIGVVLYLADYVEPRLGTPMTEGLRVSIDRSAPVQVVLDGRTVRSRTHRDRVGLVLSDLGIVLTGQDYTSPTLDAPLTADATIKVVRVSERYEVEQEPIPFESVWQPDPDLEIDNTRLLQEGAPGILHRRIHIRCEDNQEVAREVEDEHIAIPPATRISGYGTKIVVRTLNTPDGAIEYWRVIRVLATSYSASTAGTSPNSPWYGHTATGMRMRYGIVAVDPKLIGLRTQVYVPGYGVGYAGDTGGAIKGHRIDLGYDDDNLVLWYRWVDVYLLTPVPDIINYRIGS